jgi:hypothetical protein
MAHARVILHLEPQYHAWYLTAPRLAMFGKIGRLISARGGTVVLAPRLHRRLTHHEAKGDGDLHISDSANLRGTGWLNTSIAYLTGFWHLDAMGLLTGEDMDRRGALMPLGGLDHAQAQAFFEDLRAKTLESRHTRHEQMEIAPQNLPKGCIAVFLQGPAPQRHGQHYFIGPEMIELVGKAAQGRPVLVKPHPLFFDEGAQFVKEACAAGLDVALARAHIHDILAAAAVTVSINSAAAVEGFLHGTPAIICGRADFAPLCETLLDPDQMDATLASALATPRDYAPWMHWYLTRHAIAINQPEAEARILARFAEAGFDEDRLGLRRA